MPSSRHRQPLQRVQAAPLCRLVDLQFSRRLDYKQQLSARLLTMNPFYKGWLTKKGHWVQSWRRRYCVLKDVFIYYYMTETDDAPRGFIPLRNCTVQESSERPFCFSIITAPTPLMRVSTGLFVVSLISFFSLVPISLPTHHSLRVFSFGRLTFASRVTPPS